MRETRDEWGNSHRVWSTIPRDILPDWIAVRSRAPTPPEPRQLRDSPALPTQNIIDLVL
jgi:hypothetical protein